MTRPIGRPPGPHGPYAATVNGRNTAARVHAIVGQIIDELDRRRASGRTGGDIVRRACDEIEKMPALDALRALRELLPKDADAAGKVQPALSMQALFVNAAREVSKMDIHRSPDAMGEAIAPMATIIDVTPQALAPPQEVEHTANPTDDDW
jgi:hypothetical protein